MIFKCWLTRLKKDWDKLNLILKKQEKLSKRLIEKLCKQSEASKNHLKLFKLSCKEFAYFLESKQIGRLRKNFSWNWMILLHLWKSIKKTVSRKTDWWNSETIFKNLNSKRKFSSKKSDKCFKLHNGVKPYKNMQL